MVQTSPTGTSCSAKNAAIDGPRTVPTASPFYDNLSLLLLGAPPKLTQFREPRVACGPPVKLHVVVEFARVDELGLGIASVECLVEYKLRRGGHR